MTAVAAAPVSAWAPLRIGVFRAIWIAALVANLGSWMQLVAASWLMTTLTGSAALVALLQTANSLPGVAFALPAGALADVFDRRRLILLAQGWQLAVAAAVGTLTLAHAITPPLLLGLTLALAAGTTLGLPAFSAVTPELVPREQLAAAVSASSLSFTAALAVGPAIGGVLVSTLGPGFVFLLNAALFFCAVVVVSGWRRQRPIGNLPPEHVGSAIRTGIRYAVNAPELLTVLARAGAHVTLFIALPSLLSVVTRQRLHGTASDFGLLLGLFGLGGVLAAVFLPVLRRRLPTDQLVSSAAITLGLVVFAVGQARSTLVVAPLLPVAGFASMTCMSSFNIAAQEVLPAWVRGRGLAVFQLTFQLSVAVGAALWGTVAARFGLQVALTAAGLGLIASAALAIRLKLSAADGVDVTPAYRPYPHIDVEVRPEDGPVLISVEYQVPPERLAALKEATPELRRARQREGAMHWALYADVERPNLHLESYMVASWIEHRRQAERRTATDQAAIDRAAGIHAGEEPPRWRYLLGHHFRS